MKTVVFKEWLIESDRSSAVGVGRFFEIAWNDSYIANAVPSGPTSRVSRPPTANPDFRRFKSFVREAFWVSSQASSGRLNDVGGGTDIDTVFGCGGWALQPSKMLIYLVSRRQLRREVKYD